MGRLGQLLAGGEFGALRDLVLFESNFLQVTRGGDPAGLVTMALAATSPLLPAPNLLLLARPHPGGHPEPSGGLQLLGLLPLGCVRISLRCRRCSQLSLRLLTGRRFYLRLLAPPRRFPTLLTAWIRLLWRLRRQPPAHSPPP